MKIYWSYKDIPELAGLPASVGHKNYKQARSLANSHIEMWLGGVLYVVLVAGLSVAFDRVFPGKGGFARSLVTTACALVPGIFLWHQISIYVMRKYYKHILARRSAASGDLEKAAERLIEEADEREFQRWRKLRRYGYIALCILMLAVICSLAASV
ncbi:hypothetical protein M5Y49_03555 [Escherichia coli]|nr:hypothetical protein [Escherichia coli]